MNNQFIRILTFVSITAFSAGVLLFSHIPQAFSVNTHANNGSQGAGNTDPCIETGTSNGDQHGQPCDPGHNHASATGCAHGEPDCDPVVPSPTDLVTPTPTSAPADPCGDHGESCITPTPTPVILADTSRGDGLTDGKSDGRSSCPECTQAPKSNGQILSATTDFANTGTAEDILMNIIGTIGGISTTAGFILAKKRKS